MSKQHSREVSQGERFQFGANWRAFLNSLTDERVQGAEQSLRDMLDVNTFSGKRFLDLGCGSGLFSLAAMNLGAEVYSVDYDPDSVACAKELKRRYHKGDSRWVIEEGSALDESYLRSLGQFNIVYSWGVLHHTGNMMKALQNASIPVASNGQLFIAIYNDQYIASKYWTKVKKLYCSNILSRCLLKSIFIPFFAAQSIIIGLIKYKNPFGQFSNYKMKRGMSIYHDWIDWLGGYPFEVARPEVLLNLYKNQGYILENLITTNRCGCNQFVFRKTSVAGEYSLEVANLL